MKLYRLTYWCHDNGEVQEWHPSLASADRRRRQVIKNARPRGAWLTPVAEATHVPTTKTELLEWLNFNCSQAPNSADNG